VNYVNMPFANAVVENVTIIIDNNDPVENDYEISFFEDDLKSFKPIVSKHKSDFVSNKNYSLNFNSNDIVEIIESNHSKTVDNYCFVNQAIALKGDKSLSLKESNPDNKFYKLLDGRNINKYKIEWNGVYLDYDLERIHSCKRK